MLRLKKLVINDTDDHFTIHAERNGTPFEFAMESMELNNLYSLIMAARAAHSERQTGQEKIGAFPVDRWRISSGADGMTLTLRLPNGVENHYIFGASALPGLRDTLNLLLGSNADGSPVTRQ